jgi:uncharacterized protein (DUF4415 family)
MKESKTTTASNWVDPDDIPDLSTPEWVEKFKTAKVKRGRPLAAKKKVLQTLRLDPEVIDYFKGEDPKNWLTRINNTLSQLARGEAVLTPRHRPTAKPKTERKSTNAA